MCKFCAAPPNRDLMVQWKRGSDLGVHESTPSNHIKTTSPHALGGNVRIFPWSEFRCHSERTLGPQVVKSNNL